MLPDGRSALEGADYYWFFAVAMFLTALAFIPFAYQFRERTYLQPEQPAAS